MSKKNRNEYYVELSRKLLFHDIAKLGDFHDCVIFRSKDDVTPGYDFGPTVLVLSFAEIRHIYENRKEIAASLEPESRKFFLGRIEFTRQLLPNSNFDDYARLLLRPSIGKAKEYGAIFYAAAASAAACQFFWGDTGLMLIGFSAASWAAASRFAANTGSSRQKWAFITAGLAALTAGTTLAAVGDAVRHLSPVAAMEGMAAVAAANLTQSGIRRCRATPEPN